ncbi:hypothetical protein EMIT0111MI5_40129 [Burkholderia sp. IT-111MI5]
MGPTLRRTRNANVVTLRYETAETVLIHLRLNRFNNLSISRTSFSDKELPRLKPVVEPSAIEMARQLQSSPRITQHNGSSQHIFNARTTWTLRLSLMACSGRL